MVKVIGVKFKTSGRIYYFDPLDLAFSAGDGVIVETSRGVEFGEVTCAPKEVEETEIVAPLKPVLRIATEEDRRMREQYAQKEPEAFAICEQKIAEHGLDMKLVDAEYIFNGSKIVFYFTADERVDFRELVKDLAYSLRTRIELRQIGVRDEAKMLGGLGPCGRPVCCNAFLDDFRPVSIKMAKEQNLSLSPTKISGLCGRLMCCLQYEQNVYESMKKVMPKVGKEINTIDGVGTVVENNAITEKTKVRLTMEDGTIDVREYPYTHLGPVGEPLPQAALESAAQKNETETDLASMARRENRNNRRHGGKSENKSADAKPNTKVNEGQKGDESQDGSREKGKGAQQKQKQKQSEPKNPEQKSDEAKSREKQNQKSEKQNSRGGQNREQGRKQRSPKQKHAPSGQSTEQKTEKAGKSVQKEPAARQDATAEQGDTQKKSRRRRGHRSNGNKPQEQSVE